MLRSRHLFSRESTCLSYIGGLRHTCCQSTHSPSGTHPGRMPSFVYRSDRCPGVCVAVRTRILRVSQADRPCGDFIPCPSVADVSIECDGVSGSDYPRDGSDRVAVCGTHGGTGGCCTGQDDRPCGDFIPCPSVADVSIECDGVSGSDYPRDGSDRVAVCGTHGGTGGCCTGQDDRPCGDFIPCQSVTDVSVECDGVSGSDYPRDGTNCGTGRGDGNGCAGRGLRAVSVARLGGTILGASEGTCPI